jgi:hypothetical protein
LTVYDVARNGFYNLNYSSNSWELIMWRKANNVMQVSLSLSTTFNIPDVQYGLLIRLMEFRVEREIGELKRMEGNIRGT